MGIRPGFRQCENVEASGSREEGRERERKKEMLVDVTKLPNVRPKFCHFASPQ